MWCDMMSKSTIKGKPKAKIFKTLAFDIHEEVEEHIITIIQQNSLIST